MRARPFLTIGSTALLAAVPLALAPASAAAGEDHDAGWVQVLSGPTPFAAGCAGAVDDLAIDGAEIEPAITVDPTDPRHLVATWQQDIGMPAARSDLIARSDDGGRTWRTTAIPGLTVCTGGTADFAS